MGRSKELIFNTIIIGIGKFGTKIITFLLLPLYTSLLTTTEYGTYDLLYTLSILFVPIITLLMEESMFRFLIDCETEDERKKIISNAMIYIGGSLIVFVLFICMLGQFINIPHMFLFVIYLISSVIECSRNAICRGMSKIKLFAITNFVTSLIVIILNVYFIAIVKIGVEGLLLSYILANLFATLVIGFKVKFKKYISFKLIDYKKLKEMMKYSFPLVPNSVSWTIINLSDRIVISSYLGADANGIYSIANKFPAVIDSIYSFFYTAWKEAAAKNLKYEDSEEFYNIVYKVLKNFMWSFVIMMIAILPFVFEILIKNEFIYSFEYIPILIISMYFSNMSGFYGGIYSAYKDTKIMGTTTTISAILNILINLIFIKLIGIWAAVISTFIATFVVYIYRKYRLKKYVLLNNNHYEMIVSWISVFLVFVLYYFSNNMIIKLIIFIMITIYCVYINKDIIKIIIDKFKSKYRGIKNAKK